MNRPDLIPEYRARIAATMPLGGVSDINIAWVSDRSASETVRIVTRPATQEEIAKLKIARAIVEAQNETEPA